MKQGKILKVTINEFVVVIRTARALNPETSSVTTVQECEVFFAEPAVKKHEGVLWAKAYFSIGQVTALKRTLNEFFKLEENEN